ncbi:MAG TPA: winged helix-turn-helix domain-containing protein [Amycolatopsis sp.]|nr:winged helix-turn-helix domain-containing protein [Amycolatopsis sp.]
MTSPPFDPDPVGYLYEQVTHHIAQRITNGDLPPAAPPSSEQRLADEYGVSLGTVRHATRPLRFRGLVITVGSKGTYVTDIAGTADPLRDE